MTFRSVGKRRCFADSVNSRRKRISIHGGTSRTLLKNSSLARGLFGTQEIIKTCHLSSRLFTCHVSECFTTAALDKNMQVINTFSVQLQYVWVSFRKNTHAIRRDHLNVIWNPATDPCCVSLWLLSYARKHRISHQYCSSELRLTS